MKKRAACALSLNVMMKKSTMNTRNVSRNYRGNKQQCAAWALSWTWTKTQLHLTIRKVEPVGT